jgi:hypothetical protein
MRIVRGGRRRCLCGGVSVEQGVKKERKKKKGGTQKNRREQKCNIYKREQRTLLTHTPQMSAQPPLILTKGLIPRLIRLDPITYICS